MSFSKIVLKFVIDPNHGVGPQWLADDCEEHVTKMVLAMKKDDGEYPEDLANEIFSDYFLNDLFNDSGKGPNCFQSMKTSIDNLDGETALTLWKDCAKYYKDNFGMTLDITDMTIENIWNYVAYQYASDVIRDRLVEWFDYEFKRKVMEAFANEE